jgi:putative transposase
MSSKKIAIKTTLHNRYPHNPPHCYSEKGTYMVTAATLNKINYFNTPQKLALLHNLLLEETSKYNWELKTWAVFSNHYHFIASNNVDPTTLPKFIANFHRVSSIKLNALENQRGRRVWYKYWDTILTYKNSYYSRLNYVIQNAVKHKLV